MKPRTTSRQQEAAALIAAGLELLTVHADAEAPGAVIAGLVPAPVRLRTGGDATRGGAWFYLSMPSLWRPPECERGWMSAEDTDYYWTTGWAKTKNDALRLGLIKLLTVTMEAP